MLASYQPYGKDPTFFDNEGPFSDKGWFNRVITIFDYRTLPSLYTIFLSVGLFSIYLTLSLWIKRDFNDSTADIFFIVLSIIVFLVMTHYLFITFIALVNKQGYSSSSRELTKGGHIII